MLWISIVLVDSLLLNWVDEGYHSQDCKDAELDVVVCHLNPSLSFSESSCVWSAAPVLLCCVASYADSFMVLYLCDSNKLLLIIPPPATNVGGHCLLGDDQLWQHEMLQLRQMGYTGRVLCRSKWFVLMTMAVTIYILHSLPSHSTVCFNSISSGCVGVLGFTALWCQ